VVVLASVLHIRMTYVESLKDKRRILKSLLSRVSSRFNVSISEVGRHDSHDFADVGIAIASSSKTYLESVFESILSLADTTDGILSIDFEKEFIYM
jgi:uncharacterized protein